MVFVGKMTQRWFKPTVGTYFDIFSSCFRYLCNDFKIIICLPFWAFLRDVAGRTWTEGGAGYQAAGARAPATGAGRRTRAPTRPTPTPCLCLRSSTRWGWNKYLDILSDKNGKFSIMHGIPLPHCNLLVPYRTRYNSASFVRVAQNFAWSIYSVVIIFYLM